MRTNRRQVLVGGAAALGLGALPGWASGAPVLRAMAGMAQIAPEGYAETPIWGYEGTAPGPVLRVAQGARLARRVENELPQPTAVHWHGIRIDNAMDGVPGMTQDAIEPGAGFDYDFVVPDAGTYWYHSHNRSMEQVARGLHGALIVEEAAGAPEVDGERIWLLDDWRLDPETVRIDDSFGNFHDLSHAGRLGNIITTSGRYEMTESVAAGSRLRLRLINVATARVFELGLKGMRGWIVALDGMPLESPRAVEDGFALAPAQRADLIVDITAAEGEAAHLLRFERGEGISQVWIDVTAGGSARSRAPGPLPRNPGQVDIALDGATPVTLLMEGGAMRGLRNGAMHEGEQMDMRGLADKGQFWALNGHAGMPDAPLFVAERGQVIRMALGNDTAFPHAMHLHGHHFREVAEDGSLGDWRDTTLVQPGEIRQIAMVADNPGNWMLHCHMLAHSSSGMMTWYQVA